MTADDKAPLRVMVAGHDELAEGDCKIIAEAGANHNNSVDKAIDMSKAVAAAGAWAIKFQLYKAARLTVQESPKYWDDPFDTASQYEAFKLSDHMSYDDWQPVADACADLGLVFFATPFDLKAVDALERLQVPIYKLASADITYRKLIEIVAETGKPVLMSTGASTLDEIERAIEWSGLGPEKLIPLGCTLTYPTPDDDANFSRIETMRRALSPYLIGMSDHSIGPDGAWVAAALGAVCLEKHFTITPLAGDIPDHAMSVTPDELAQMVAAGRRGATLRGSSEVMVADSELPARNLARRSIVSSLRIPRGTIIDVGMVDCRRPGTGIPAFATEDVVGKRAMVDIPSGVLIQPKWIS